MKNNVKGAWAVHHASKLDYFPSFTKLDKLRTAGNCGMLLSALSATHENQMSMHRAETLAGAAGIDLTYQFKPLLETLRTNGLVDFTENAVAVLGLTTRSILENTGKLFDGLDPSPAEYATIEVAEVCSDAPHFRSDLETYVGDTYHLASKDSSQLLGTIQKVGLCDTETLERDMTLFFNGALFKHGETTKIKAVIDSLTSTDQNRIAAFGQRLNTEGCVEKFEAATELGDKLFRKLHAIGMYDVSTVSNDSDNIEYVTRPSAFNKFGQGVVADAFDLAKAFVASLQYGMTRSSTSRGKISMLQALMRKLIRGETLNPCTAIGQDYQILEMRGVVQVIPDGSMYRMKLLKKDVGELALAVLTSGDASEYSLIHLPGSSISGYSGPEINRISERKNAHDRNIDVSEVLRSLRTGAI